MMANLWLTNLPADVTDEISGWLEKYGFPTCVEIIRVPGDGDEAADPLPERAELQRQFDEMDAAMAQYGAGATGLGHQLDIVRDTLLSARELVRIEARRLHLDSVNAVPDESRASGPAIECEYLQAPKMNRAFAAVRIQRTDVRSGGLSIAAVERTL